MGKYGQVFTLQFPTGPDRVWTALKLAVDDMDGAKSGTVHEGERRLEFSTGVTLTSWGEEMEASVGSAGTGAAEVQVRGKPKGTLLTTKAGEVVHANTVERRLRRGVEEHLASANA